MDKHNNTNHRSIGEKPVDANYSALSKEIETSPKSPKFQVGDKVRITKYKNIYSKGYAEIWYKQIFVIEKQ